MSGVGGKASQNKQANLGSSLEQDIKSLGRGVTLEPIQ